GVADAAPLVADLFATADTPGRETVRIQRLSEDLKRAEAFARTSALLKLGLPAIAISLVPGSVVLEIDREHAILYVHVLGADRPEKIERARATIIATERRLLRALGSRDEWEADSAARKQRAEDSSEAMQALFGGIDPANPQAAEELAQRLQRQEGWKRVDYRGDGLFDVEFAIESRLGHDFMFPTLERFPMVNSFVLANLRQGNQVRIEAPGFAAQGGGNPFAGMMSGMAGMASVAAGASGSGANLPKIPDLDGTFRIVTDGRILANNTDEGPAETPRGQVLEWRINARTQSPPMALIALGD
ncbi:MAG: hypothetical protein B7Z08_04265, partial [Sphingomonadales bacterium 32-68-7]